MEEHLFIDRLTKTLVDMGALDRKDSADLARLFANSSHEMFDDFLLKEGFVDKESLLKALSDVHQVPYVDVEGYFFQTFLLRQFPRSFLIRNAVIPYERDDNILMMIASDPSNESLLDEIGTYVSYDIQFDVGIYQDIIDAIEDYYDTSLTETEDVIQNIPYHNLDDLPFKQEDRDSSVLLKQEIDQYARTESESERENIEERAHNAQKKR